MKNNKSLNLANSLNLSLNKLPVELDVLTLVFLVFLVVLCVNKVEIPEYSQLAFLLALILLMSCYNIEISIVVVLISIVYVMVQNNRKDNEE